MLAWHPLSYPSSLLVTILPSVFCTLRAVIATGIFKSLGVLMYVAFFYLEVLFFIWVAASFMFHARFPNFFISQSLYIILLSLISLIDLVHYFLIVAFRMAFVI